MLQTQRSQDSCPFLDGHTDVLISRGSYWLKISGEFWYEFFIVGIDNCDELQKFIILSVHVNGEPIRGRTKIQKILFLLSDVIQDIKDQSSYEADNYGPYSEVVNSELEYLEQIGVLLCGNAEISTTNVGSEIAEELAKTEDKDTMVLLSDYKAFLNDLPTNEVLAYVYSAYPDMTIESAVVDKIKPNMERYMLSLVKRQKISSQRAAELLVKPHNHVIERMNEAGMTVLE